MGYANGGSLANGVRLIESETVRYLPGRPHHHGTEELVGLVRRAAASVARSHPGSRLTVGDLSDHDGGPIGHHASHQSGRDVDLSFYVSDERGRPRLADDYLSFNGRGRPIAGGALRFDVARNWALVSALLEDPSVQVEHVFVSNPLRALLIAHARASGARPMTLVRAQLVLHQPVGALPHSNHFHVRIACPPGDSQCVEGIRPRPRPRRRVVATGRGSRREAGRVERRGHARSR
jgi:penicillin-insensitive murein endopeptidase